MNKPVVLKLYRYNCSCSRSTSSFNNIDFLPIIKLLKKKSRKKCKSLDPVGFRTERSDSNTKSVQITNFKGTTKIHFKRKYFKCLYFFVCYDIDDFTFIRSLFHCIL